MRGESYIISKYKTIHEYKPIAVLTQKLLDVVSFNETILMETPENILSDSARNRCKEITIVTIEIVNTCNENV